MTKEERIEELIRLGFSNKEIACTIHLSERSVRWYVGKVMRKLGLYGPADERRLVVRLLEAE